MFAWVVEVGVVGVVGVVGDQVASQSAYTIVANVPLAKLTKSVSAMPPILCKTSNICLRSAPSKDHYELGQNDE